MSKLLVTGAAGFLGSHLVLRALKDGFEVVALDVVPRSAATKLADVGQDEIEYQWVALQDIGSIDADYVVHAAAIADVPFALNSPFHVFEQNALGTLALLEALRDLERLKRVIIVSTDAVYGLSSVVPIPEGARLNPSNVYGASKAAQELLGLAYYNSYGVPVTIVRSSNLYGEGMRLEQVVAMFLRQALIGAPITIEGDGSQTRDFNYVGNIVDGILLALTEENALGVTMNLSSGDEVSIRELAERSIAVTGSTSEVQFLPGRPGEKGVRLVLDPALARETLGYRPKVTFEEGLKRTAEWLAGSVGITT